VELLDAAAKRGVRVEDLVADAEESADAGVIAAHTLDHGMPASARSASVRWKICTGATRLSTVAWKSSLKSRSGELLLLVQQGLFGGEPLLARHHLG
jgi:hypothetical protein